MTAELEPHILRKFEIKKRVGKGAYGIVWKAVNYKTKEVVALKKNFDAFRNQTDAQRTFREIAFLQAFQNHPNIISLFNVIKASCDKDIYLVFEYMETDLHNVIKKGNILRDVHKQFIIYQLLKAILYLHSGEVIHRDLKPSNVLLDSECTVKLCDFGLARSLRGRSNGLKNDENSNPNGPNIYLPALTEYVATRWYRAPEILLACHDYTKGVDLWSLGCILGEMLNGAPLFPGKSTLNQIERIMAAIPKPTKTDIQSLKSPYLNSLMDRPPSRLFQPLEKTLGNSSKIALDLMYKMLKFNPLNRIDAKQALKHAYCRKFYSPNELIVMKHHVVPPLDDNVQLTVSEYQNHLYDTPNKSEMPMSKSTKPKQIKPRVKSSIDSHQESKNNKPITQYFNKNYDLLNDQNRPMTTFATYSKQIDDPEATIRNVSTKRPFSQININQDSNYENYNNSMLKLRSSKTQSWTSVNNMTPTPVNKSRTKRLIPNGNSNKHLNNDNSQTNDSNNNNNNYNTPKNENKGIKQFDQLLNTKNIQSVPDQDLYKPKGKNPFLNQNLETVNKTFYTHQANNSDNKNDNSNNHNSMTHYTPKYESILTTLSGNCNTNATNRLLNNQLNKNVEKPCPANAYFPKTDCTLINTLNKDYANKPNICNNNNNPHLSKNYHYAYRNTNDEYSTKFSNMWKMDLGKVMDMKNDLHKFKTASIPNIQQQENWIKPAPPVKYGNENIYGNQSNTNKCPSELGYHPSTYFTRKKDLNEMWKNGNNDIKTKSSSNLFQVTSMCDIAKSKDYKMSSNGKSYCSIPYSIHQSSMTNLYHAQSSTSLLNGPRSVYQSFNEIPATTTTNASTYLASLYNYQNGGNLINATKTNTGHGKGYNLNKDCETPKMSKEDKFYTQFVMDKNKTDTENRINESNGPPLPNSTINKTKYLSKPSSNFSFKDYNPHPPQTNHYTPTEKTRFHSFITTSNGMVDNHKTTVSSASSTAISNTNGFHYTSTKLPSTDSMYSHFKQSDKAHFSIDPSYKHHHTSTNDYPFQYKSTSPPKAEGANNKNHSILELYKIRELNKINMKSLNNNSNNANDKSEFPLISKLTKHKYNTNFTKASDALWSCSVSMSRKTPNSIYTNQQSATLTRAPTDNCRAHLLSDYSNPMTSNLKNRPIIENILNNYISSNKSKLTNNMHKYKRGLK